MARKRRQGEVFSMSFLDCMSCGFGAVILFFMIINSHVNATVENENSELMAETNRLEIEVLEGRKNLALKRNTMQKLKTETDAADGQIAQIIALIQELQAELDKYDQDTLAKIERVEKLQSDIKSLEEEVKRLLAIKQEQDQAGEQIRTTAIIVVHTEALQQHHPLSSILPCPSRVGESDSQSFLEGAIVQLG